MNTFFSVLEQFDIIPFIPFFFYSIDFSITNETIILFLIFNILYILRFSFLSNKNFSHFIIPSYWQYCLENIFQLILNMVNENINSTKGQLMYPLVFAIFFYTMLLNLSGLPPYSFTLTSHFLVTFSLSFSIFLGINILCLIIHGSNIFSLFLPSGTSIFLAFLLIPIEIISHIFKPISLSIRLFANMMGGHTLLKVIAGFIWTLKKKTGLLFLFHYFPVFILIPLFGLEVGVALIQSFVFSILTCVYLNEALNLH
jgi:ATP synthase subunit 6